MVPEQYIYADYAASEPVCADARACVSEVEDYFANPSSIHTKGREARALIESARARVAHVFDVLPQEIYFTSGGTESNNLALRGVLHAIRRKDSARIPEILVSSIEHASVLETARDIHSLNLGRVVEVPVDMFGVIQEDSFRHALSENTALVSVMYVNNEIGTIQPIKKLSNTVRGVSNRAVFHTDACQAAGHVALKPKDIGVHMMTLGGTKIGAPHGVGVLYVDSDIAIHPVQTGGGQERSVRGGTENISAIAGFAAALEYKEKIRIHEMERIHTLRRLLIELLCHDVTDIHINGHPTDVSPHILHVTIPYIEGEALLLLLDAVGIAVSTGSACAGSDLLPSHVMRATHTPEELLHGSIRISIGEGTSEDDVRVIAREMVSCIQKLRSYSAVTSQVYGKSKK